MLPKTLEELDHIRKDCYCMVAVRAVVSGSASLIPIPGTDIAADVGMLLQLIPAISKRFGLDKEQINQFDPHTKALVLRLIQAAGSRFIGKLVTEQVILQILKKVGLRYTTKQIVKYIPFVGQATSAVVGFSAMWYVGNSHVEDCYEIARRVLEEGS
ncbi:hypothetical protein EV586_10937 [Tumebacillus sp. BK434]|uniref:hypothetical protein n=1 Tax=Tumebacillus sp. BK434 TaxID=2512169 RepID=UPI00104E672E|nr:hypothetical protein [Tumebacillus sp. BK434]TCP52556.1 hypothetical protein EV586_10937 [Tumebacillus sp. BK434]